jgi:hypothetical protein
MKTKNPIHMKFAAGLSRALAPSLVTLLALSSLSRAAVIADYNADFGEVALQALVGPTYGMTVPSEPRRITNP